MKRSNPSVSNNTRSKKPRLSVPCESNISVSATSLFNFMKHDTLSDWMKYNSVNKKGEMSEFTKFILSRGNKFEDDVIEYIDKNIHRIVKVSDKITDYTCKKTLEFMKAGVPLIHSAPVINPENKTMGVIDLLVRSDYISCLVDFPPLSYKEGIINAPILGRNKYHYVVVDIKFTTLNLCSDGIKIRNCGNIPAYKAQCMVYTEAIGRMQGYTPPYAFIMGRRTSFTRSGLTYNDYTPFGRLGRINYEDEDRKYKHLTNEAIAWVKDVRRHGAAWSVNPPSRPELYPNMSVDSGIWQTEKRKISNIIGELTEIWNVGHSQRALAIKQGITDWRDERCNSDALGMSPNRGSLVDKILEINRQSEVKIYPDVIQNNFNDWKTKGNDLYIDFETLSDIFAPNPSVEYQRQSEIIFMIGVGWEEEGKWNHKRFICKELTYESEFHIMRDFVNFVRKRGNPKLYHWSADEKFWNSAVKRQLQTITLPSNILEERLWRYGDTDIQDEITDNWTLNGWTDLCKLFQNESIVLKDCFNYGLKNIAKAMKKHGMIDVDLDTECDSGTSAMVNAWNCYNTPGDVTEMKTMEDISKYNEFDCKVLWEILTYLRDNHA